MDGTFKNSTLPSLANGDGIHGRDRLVQTEHHAEAVWPSSGSVPGGNKDRGPLMLLIFFFNLKCPSWFASITTNPRTTTKTPCPIWMGRGATGPDTEAA